MVDSDAIFRELNGSPPVGKIERITPIADRVVRPDSTAKFSLRARRGEFVLIVSSEVSPLSVRRAADRQKELKAKLSGRAAEPIELPVREGLIDEKSYGVWTKRKPIKLHRPWAKIEILCLAPKVFNWVREVASMTAQPVETSKLIDDLRAMEEISELSAETKAAAVRAINGFRAGEILPRQVAQHGDLWIGNILKSPSATGFIVIDWAGAKSNGAPFFDLVNFALSVGSTRSRLRTEIASYAEILGCLPHHAIAYVLGGFGALYADRKYFPRESLLRLCENNVNALRAVIEDA